MAKRVIHECDLTKREFDPEDDQVFTLSIAKKGRKAPMKYELSAAAAEQLLAQLNGRKELREGWSFYSPGDMTPHPPGVRGGESPRRRTLGDLEEEVPQEADEPFEDDAKFVTAKKASLREEGVLGDDPEEETPRELPQDGPVGKAMGASTGSCSHMNKGRVQITMRGGKRYVYRKCVDCRKEFPEMSSEARQQYMSGKPPKGVRIRDL